jgi:hypothetical protein
VETNAKGAKKTSRSRYWSVMLVGDHGRVIPFRHFKALTVGVGIVLMLSMGALVLLGVLVTHQRNQIGGLQHNLEQLSDQSTKLRDEKDLYLTQLIALQKQTGTLPQKKTDEPLSMSEGSKSEVETKEPPESEKAANESEKAAKTSEKTKQEVAVRKTEPLVEWSADIRNFKVSYDNRQGVLNAELRIYNTSRPKKRLNGRTVVVFKVDGEPPAHWAVVPAVPLNNDTPLGKDGRFFNIRNYQTEKFKTLRRKDSPQYDVAAVYIFSDKDGELIAHKTMPFNVDYSPPAPVQPVIAPTKPEPEKTTGTPQISPAVKPEPAQKGPEASAPPKQDQNAGGSPSTLPSSDTPSGALGPTPPPGNKQPDSELDSVGNGPSGSAKTGSVPQTPAPEPKPVKEGDTK